MGKHFTSLADKRKRGVVIYVKNEIIAELKYKDSKGRMVTIEVKRENVTFLIAAIYAPNKNQGTYFKMLHEQLCKLGGNNICVIGDFNGIVDPDKNYKSGGEREKRTDKLPKSSFDLMDKLNLVDIW